MVRRANQDRLVLKEIRVNKETKERMDWLELQVFLDFLESLVKMD